MISLFHLFQVLMVWNHQHMQVCFHQSTLHLFVGDSHLGMLDECHHRTLDHGHDHHHQGELVQIHQHKLVYYHQNIQRLFGDDFHPSKSVCFRLRILDDAHLFVPKLTGQDRIVGETSFCYCSPC